MGLDSEMRKILLEFLDQRKNNRFGLFREGAAAWPGLLLGNTCSFIHRSYICKRNYIIYIATHNSRGRLSLQNDHYCIQEEMR